MGTMEGVQYRGGTQITDFFLTVLNISPTFIMISPMVLNIPTVLKISPACIVISPTVLHTHYTDKGELEGTSAI